MKRIIYLFLFTVLLGTVACKKYVADNEVSPNLSADAPINLVLSEVELSMFNTYNGQLNRTASMWSQQNAGNQFQAGDVGTSYSYNENDVINEWRVIYANGIKNCKIIERKAGTTNPYYLGISQVMSALLLGVATDLWGDVPYKNAFKGEDLVYNSAYDAQSDVLSSIQTLLDNAITNFSKAKSANVFLPGTDDYVYNGDPAKWKAAAYVLKARYYNRLSKQSANSYVDVLTAVTNAKAAGFTGNSANANAMFGTNSNEYNQWYAFIKVERQTYINASQFFIDMLQNSNDPRLPFYFTKNDSNTYAGNANGELSASNKSEMGDFYASPDSKQPLITYNELLFLEAEANFNKGDKPAAATAHNDAVKANLQLVTGAANPAYVAANASETGATITLNKIMTQKYISNFAQIEVYNDWRRTNIPALTKSPASNLAGIPRRVPTSVEERQYNTSATVIANLLTPVWWDK